MTKHKPRLILFRSVDCDQYDVHFVILVIDVMMCYMRSYSIITGLSFSPGVMLYENTKTT